MMRWRIALLLLVFILVLVPFVSALPFAGSAKSNKVLPVQISIKPEIRFASSSTNWGGYVVTGPTGSVTNVNGSWTVPSVSCTSASTYAAFWVGIDGFSDTTVEQTGVLAECSGGSASYSAWYEFYPNPMYTISTVSVSPGNQISADVSATGGGGFTVTLTDVTTGASYSTSSTVSGAQQSSAEGIVERPSLCNAFSCTLSTLANYGSVSFGFDYTSVSGTNYATVSGTTGTIGSFSTYQSITMVNNNGAVLAQPSPLSPDGTSFTVPYGSSTTTTSSSTSATTTVSSSSSTSPSSSTSRTTSSSSSSTKHHRGF